MKLASQDPSYGLPCADLHRFPDLLRVLKGYSDVLRT